MPFAYENMEILIQIHYMNEILHSGLLFFFGVVFYCGGGAQFPQPQNV